MRISKKTTFTAKPGCIKQLREVLSQISEPIRKDKGCVHFEIFHDQENPIKFFSVETWENEQSLQNHKKTDHYDAFIKKYLEFSEGKYEMQLDLLG